MRIGSIYVIGRVYRGDRRLEVLRRLPADVAGLILAVRMDPDPGRAWIALRRESEVDRAFVDEFLDLVEAEIDRETGGRDPAAGVTFQ